MERLFGQGATGIPGPGLTASQRIVSVSGSDPSGGTSVAFGKASPLRAVHSMGGPDKDEGWPQAPLDAELLGEDRSISSVVFNHPQLAFRRPLLQQLLHQVQRLLGRVHTVDQLPGPADTLLDPDAHWAPSRSPITLLTHTDLCCAARP
jgi:hypothetical protein